MSRITTVITHIRGLTTPLITTHEPPSRPSTLYPCRIPIDPFKGTLKGTLITTPEPPSGDLKLRLSGRRVWDFRGKGSRAQGV